MPKVSVIIPVYQAEKYIKSCIDSILEQSFSDFELLLIDDGSTDQSGAICDNYAQMDKRVKVIHQKNAGVSAARNAGLEICCGEYVTFVDADDCIDRGFLEYAVNVVSDSAADIFFKWLVYGNLEKRGNQQDSVIWHWRRSELDSQRTSGKSGCVLSSDLRVRALL